MTDRFIPSNCESYCYAVKITNRGLGEEKKEIGGGEVEHILSLSYGKDSLACLGAIEELKWPLDRIIHAEVWATDTIPADLPPMVEFNEIADAIIKDRLGITVEHVKAPHTAEQRIYRKRIMGKRVGQMVGWPRIKGCDIQSSCKREPLAKATKGAISYWGIAADEPNRIKKHKSKPNVRMPLVEAGWSEEDCREWCKKNGLLSPIYTDAKRGGCWFCPQQIIGNLRILRKMYPEYWALMMKWDTDSPMKFKADGHTVHDFERRFQMEDDGLLSSDGKVFRWNMLDDELNYRLF